MDCFFFNSVDIAFNTSDLTRSFMKDSKLWKSITRKLWYIDAWNLSVLIRKNIRIWFRNFKILIPFRTDRWRFKQHNYKKTYVVGKWMKTLVAFKSKTIQNVHNSRNTKLNKIVSLCCVSPEIDTRSNSYRRRHFNSSLTWWIWWNRNRQKKSGAMHLQYIE